MPSVRVFIIYLRSVIPSSVALPRDRPAFLGPYRPHGQAPVGEAVRAREALADEPSRDRSLDVARDGLGLFVHLDRCRRTPRTRRARSRWTRTPATEGTGSALTCGHRACTSACPSGRSIRVMVPSGPVLFHPRQAPCADEPIPIGRRAILLAHERDTRERPSTTGTRWPTHAVCSCSAPWRRPAGGLP